MALVVADRIKETTSTTGTGTYTLAGASTGFEAFSVIGDGNTTYYCCTDGTDFEVGIGTYTASGTTLARTTILQSSNSDSAVNWGSGTRDIFVTQPAEKAVFLNASDNIELADNEKIILGTGSDLEISHTGTNSLIVDNGTGNLFLQSNGNGIFLTTPAAAENMLRALKDGAVELYHDNSKKIETTSTGATVTGVLIADGVDVGDNEKLRLGASQDLEIFHDGSNSAIIDQGTGGLFIRGTAINIDDSSSNDYITATEGGAVTLFHNGSARLITTSTGAKVTGGTGDGVLTIEADTDNADESDNALLTLTQDGGIVSATFGFDGTNNIFIKGTGSAANIQLMDGDEILAKGIPQGAFELYHNNSKKLETASGGISVTGEIAATSLDISGDVDVDGTLEADAMTLNGTAITSTATLSTGISNNNVPKFTSGVADNDFLRVDGTSIEGRSASEVLSDIGGISASSTDTLTNKTLTTPVINGFSGTGNGSITGDLTLTSTDAGSGDDPTLDLYRNSSSPADNDVLGHINFSGENDAGQKVIYAEIQTSIADATDGTEDARLQLGGRHNGTFLTYYEAKFGLNTFNRDAIFTNDTGIIFEGATNDGNETTLNVTDPTADRTITLPDATGTVLLADGDGSSLTNVNATTLDSVDSTSFLRSDAADTKTSGNLHFSDSVKATFGDTSSPDLEIFHDGNSSLIDDRGTGSLFIRSSQVNIQNNPSESSRENMATFVENGAVTLMHNGSSKIATTSDGATVTGDLTLTSTANDGGVLKLVSDDPADATDFGTEGQIQFFAENSASQSTQYYSLQMRTADITDGTEDGWLYLNSIADGTLNTANAFGSDGTFYLLGNGNAPNAVIKWFQTKGTSHNVSLAVSTPSASRTITLPDASGTVQLTDGSGASLTSLNASQLSSGTVPNARLDAQLQDVAGLAVTNGGFIVGDGSNFVLETGSTARASLELGTAAVLDTGISNTNIPKFTSGVADNDFLRVDGTSIEGRSASEVLSDIGAQASLTFGISNTNAVKIDSSSVADNEFARFTANGLESRSTSEVLSDIGAITASSTDTLTNKTINASQLSGTVADARLSSAVLTTSNSDAPATTTSSSDADFVLVDDGGTMKKITPANLGISSNQDYGLITSSTASSQDYGAIT